MYRLILIFLFITGTNSSCLSANDITKLHLQTISYDIDTMLLINQMEINLIEGVYVNQINIESLFQIESDPHAIIVSFNNLTSNFMRKASQHGLFEKYYWLLPHHTLDLEIMKLRLDSLVFTFQCGNNDEIQINEVYKVS